jgi:hypothetical protein
VSRDTKSVLLKLAAWFGLALGFGLTNKFAGASAPLLALTVWGLTALLLLAWWKMSAANQWAREVDLSRLIALHVTRFVGVYFLLLCQGGELSCVFAKPAGVGDIATAIGATILVLWRLSGITKAQRIAILAWNIFGLIDILAVVFTAFRVGLTDWQGMAPLRTLPLMLLPTFFVPLIIASHILIFVRLRNAPGKRRDELVSSH